MVEETEELALLGDYRFMPLDKQLILENFMLSDVGIFSNGGLIFTGVAQEALESGTPMSAVLYWDGGSWSKGPILPFEAVSLTLTSGRDNRAVILGRQGHVAAVSGESTTDLPLVGDYDYSGPFRRILNISERLFVLGEDRGLYMLRADHWQQLSNGLPSIDFSAVADDEEAYQRIAGETEVWFSFAGLNEKQICSVGSGGEIWHWDGTIWHRADSPTNLVLTDTFATEDNRYLICGQRGLVFYSDREFWTILCSENPPLELSCVCKFHGRVYLADGHGVFALEGDAITPVKLQDGTIFPAHRLISRSELLVSLASKDVFISSDGATWEALL